MLTKDFRALRVNLASPEEILSWSYGEVVKPETINYRRLRPEKGGLFCEAIFGPTRDWQCFCGKYKTARYKGIICDKCGVEVTRKEVRRERMGHIELATPVAHIWYARRVPSYLGLLLNLSRRDLDRILYFAQYIITNVDEGAKERALRRLEENLAKERERLESETRERIEEIEGHLEEEVKRLEEVGEDAYLTLEEKLTSITEEIMGEAKSLQSKITSLQGKRVQTPIVFSFTMRKVVEAGEEVGREHLAALSRAVQDALEAVEAEIREQQEKDRALIEEEIENQRLIANRKIEEERAKLSQDIEALEASVEADKEELRGLANMQLLSEARYRELKAKWGQVFKAGMGAEALYEILKEMDLDEMAKELWGEIRSTRSKQVRKKATKRLRLVEALRRSGNRPEWMILTVLPVIPPDLRPMVQLDGGRFATSDLNDLYRRVINRNNRLKRLIELDAPDVIIRNEKRMLQEAVDSLIDNSQTGKALSRRGRRELKSLSDMLRGKKGRFRRNLLGKRVDYSGRSVIVIGPELKLHQCGLPRSMALELYKPFIISKLVEYNYASNMRGAKRLIDRERPEVWEVLEKVVKERPVLLNRAPTLHRLGIQAFEPILVDGKAIRIHPLVCAAFNADFDGDQMAVYIPLSKAAVEEARKLMLSTKNLLKPASGEPIVGPTKDMVLGCYYLTMEKEGLRGEGKSFTDFEEVSLAYELGKVDLHAKIRFRASPNWEGAEDGWIETTVGRVIFNEIIPDEIRFVNDTLDKGKLQRIVGRCYQRLGSERTVELVDKIKEIGFHYATKSGITIAVEDLTIPEEKMEIISKAASEVEEFERLYRRGLLTEEEQYSKTIEIWTRATDEVTKAVTEALDPESPIKMMASSGATKGGFQPIRQLAGMRGLMADPSGRIIPLPILSNFREGLSALEYFISTHGARKGLADTAIRTADAGYLTRRLVDVVQDVIINAEDCGTEAGIWIREKDDVGGQSLEERVLGRIAASPVIDPKTGEVIVDAGEMVEEEEVKAIKDAGVEEVYVRSPMTCKLRHGICAKCYGRDLGRGKMVNVGAAVGIIAAQSIGEPGTQLTLRTFHTGGIAGVSDITQGLPRVEELLEARKHPKGEAIMSDIEGVVEIWSEGGKRQVRVVDRQILSDEYEIPADWNILVEEGDEIAQGKPIARLGEEEIVAKHGGRVSRDGRNITVAYERREERRYDIPFTIRLAVVEGDRVVAGQNLTEGSKNPHRILRILGKEATQLYLLSEVQKVYRSQGVNINDKHFEIIIRKMLSQVMVTSSGDTHLLPGELVNHLDFAEINAEITSKGGRPATAKPVLLGITKAALNTDGFLSAASFQHTVKVLAEAAFKGAKDDLLGLKENVIIGKLICAGTGFRGDEKEGFSPIESYEGVSLE